VRKESGVKNAERKEKKGSKNRKKDELKGKW
jgi:hypothetical protein